jgi:hypothetical protein
VAIAERERSGQLVNLEPDRSRVTFGVGTGSKAANEKTGSLDLSFDRPEQLTGLLPNCVLLGRRGWATFDGGKADAEPEPDGGELQSTE